MDDRVLSYMKSSSSLFLLIISLVFAFNQISLAQDNSIAEEVLIGVDYQVNKLFLIDIDQGDYAEIGDTPEGDRINCLAYNPLSKRLYGVEDFRDELVEIEFTEDSVEIISIGESSNKDILGLAFDIDGNLYGVHNKPPTCFLVRFDLNTGDSVIIGDIGFAGLGSLASDSSGNLYSVKASTGEILFIDKSSGIGSILGSIGLGTWNIGGLEYYPDTNSLLASDNNEDLLYSISLDDFSVSIIAEVGELNNSIVSGLAFVDDFFLVPEAILVSPSAGVFTSTQNTDLSFILNSEPDSLEVFLNNLDVTSLVVPRLIRGSVPSTGQISYRFPSLPLNALGSGISNLDVNAFWDSGEFARGSTTFEVLNTVE